MSLAVCQDRFTMRSFNGAHVRYLDVPEWDLSAMHQCTYPRTENNIYKLISFYERILNLLPPHTPRAWGSTQMVLWVSFTHRANGAPLLERFFVEWIALQKSFCRSRGARRWTVMNRSGSPTCFEELSSKAILLSIRHHGWGGLCVEPAPDGNLFRYFFFFKFHLLIGQVL